MASGDAADDTADHPALVALTELGRDAMKSPTEAELHRGLSAVRTRLAAERPRRRALLQGALVGLSVALLAVTTVRLVPAFWKTSPAQVPPLAVNRIEGGSLLAGGYLSQSGHAGIKLFFNEGTTFVLMPGARGRLREVARDGARLAIEGGAASFQVTPDSGRKWSIEAGPFLVSVKGTVFDVAWDPVSERFELMLRRGQVVVSGPVVGRGIPLQAGHRLVILLPKAASIITEERPDEESGGQVSESEAPHPAGASAEASVTAAPPREPAARREAVRPSAAGIAAPPAFAKAAEERRWKQLLAAGQWDRILADVDRAGVDAALADASSDDLFTVADAARYRRRADLARAALLTQRRRFPGSPRSLDALFLLGRVEELRQDGKARAIRLYDEYLAAAPNGAYAAEALGRKMILANDLGGPTSARRIADEYLIRFPSGSYSGAARALKGAP